ncbi:MAG: YdcF family protein [Lachnospiraceae bacterium]|nr:YdcF family protein [Lachnospiraceae bacterium]
MKKMMLVCYALAVLCILYCVGVILTKAAGTKFFLIWLVMAVILGLVGYGFGKGIFWQWPFGVRAFLGTVVCCGLVFFFFVESLILSRSDSKGEDGLAYIIVLGAQMKENGPSIALARRLDCAAAYLEKNPDSLCIVSGGQGSNEPVSEALGMYEYLVKKGILPERIIMEDQSYSTRQNLMNSRALVPPSVVKVGIVTNNFHVYRSVQLAKSQGFPEAVGMGSGSGYYFLPNNLLREFFGVMKDWMFGNMELM